MFLFFANITNIITFGGVIETMLDKQIVNSRIRLIKIQLNTQWINKLKGTIENLFSGALCGVIFALFSGQPLNILSATGPMLVFESILYKFCLWVHHFYLLISIISTCKLTQISSKTFKHWVLPKQIVTQLYNNELFKMNKFKDLKTQL